MSAPHLPGTLRSSCRAGVALLVFLLLFCTAVSAMIVTSPVPTATQKMIVVKPTTTPVFIKTAATIPIVATSQPLATCGDTSQCLLLSEAVAAWGEDGYFKTSGTPCGYSTATIAAPLPKYCYRQKTTVVQTLPLQTVTTQFTIVPFDTATVPITQVQTVSHTPVIVETVATLDHSDIQAKPCPGMEECNGQCVDIHGSDSNNCGGCGWVCPEGLSCDGGECMYSCPAGTIECQLGECVDYKNDNDNCGACGNQCGNREICSNGFCSSLCSADPNDMDYFSWADWQDTNWMTTVKNQAACGSCWAQASTGATEALYNIEGNFRYPFGYNLDLSEQALVSGCYGDHGSCTGGDHGDALDVLTTQGVAEDSYMPYQSLNCAHMEGDNVVCNADIVGHCSIPGACTLGNVPANRIWKITSHVKETDEYEWASNGEVATIKKAILCHGPLTACSGNWWHCVDIVGWQGSYWDNDGGWLVKNSWGTGWRTDGIGLIPYGEPLSNNKDKQGYGDMAMDAWSVSGVYHG